MPLRPTSTQLKQIALAYTQYCEPHLTPEELHQKARALEARFKKSSPVILNPRRFSCDEIQAVVFIHLADVDNSITAFLGRAGWIKVADTHAEELSRPIII
jgi:hypothetical protein